MAMYRKTALVSAEQFLPSQGLIPMGVGHTGFGAGDPWVLSTLEGEHILRDGDYVCTGPAGERWNVEQTIFEATYERVD